jgi:hypothetical protein
MHRDHNGPLQVFGPEGPNDSNAEYVAVPAMERPIPIESSAAYIPAAGLEVGEKQQGAT